jgi:CheY-like chemotaxis protein
MARILYLEDEEDLVRYLPGFLKEKGLEMFATTSIEEALEKFAEEDFDAVLLDIMMPPEDDWDAEQLDYGRVTGLEIARRMKGCKPHTPIVAFTVITDPKVMENMRQAGIVVTIHKPSELDQIVTTLKQVAGKS